MECERQLSIKQRYLLTYIKYRTNNNHKFFAGNEIIAKAIGCTKGSTKVIVNKLVREGYIVKITDDKGRRVLSLSGKDFMPLDGVNMGNADKHILKQEIGNLEDDVTYYKKQLAEATSRIKLLEQAILQQNEIVQKYAELTNREKAEVTTKNTAPEVTTDANATEQRAFSQQENVTTEPKQTESTVRWKWPEQTETTEGQESADELINGIMGNYTSDE